MKQARICLHPPVCWLDPPLAGGATHHHARRRSTMTLARHVPSTVRKSLVPTSPGFTQSTVRTWEAHYCDGDF